MSREAAWRIHIVFGQFTIIFGTVHGIYAFAAKLDVFGNAMWTLGLVGTILMLLGVFPFVLLVKLKVMRYDVWKVVHFLSMLGYVLAIIHMIDHAATFKTARSITVTAVNIMSLVVFIAQKVYVKATAARLDIKDAVVLEEPSGRHVFLTLSASGLPKPAPGQWGYLGVPSISPVPHPFTLIPGTEEDEVKIFIKASGKFTSKLADACGKGIAGAPKMTLEGPFGEPPLPDLRVDAVAFVLGGVGVTPSLSLMAEARNMCGDKVCVYWALRSPGLLQQCAPLMQPHINTSQTCIRVRGAEGSGSLPLEAKEGSEDVGQWLERISPDLYSRGAKTALLFCCGPASLSAAATKAVGRLSQGVSWHVHVEQFLFLPDTPGCKSQRRGGQSNVPVRVIGASS